VKDADADITGKKGEEKMKKIIIMAVLFALALTSQATLLLEEHFDNPALGSPISTASDPWIYNGNSADAQTLTGKTGLSYGSLAVSGNSIGGQDGYVNVSSLTTLSQRYTTGIDSGALYGSALIKVTSLENLTTGNINPIAFLYTSLYGAMGIQLNSGGTTFNIVAGYSMSTQQMVMDNGGAGYNVGDTIMVVWGSLDAAGGGANNTDAFLYVNPLDATLGAAIAPTPDMTASWSTRASSTTVAYIQPPWTGTGGTMANYTIDEFRVGTTWADVTPIPEPATVGMLGLGAIVTLLIRRMRG
jgi:hypothetical protein